MHKLLALPALFFFVAAGAAPAAEVLRSNAPFALLVDYESGVTLYEKSADEPMEPGSTTKLLTAEIVFDELKQGRLHLDDLFTVSEYAWRTGGAHRHGPAMFLAPKSRVRVEDLLRGLLIQSGNDAAITLAEGVGGTSAAFVDRMNARAAELKMTHSHFTNPWGASEPGHRATARDMALLAAHIIRDDPDYYPYFSEKDFTWNKVHQLNRNSLLTLNIGADGLKTGETAEGGYGLVGSAIQNGRRLVVVVNGLKSAAERLDEARKLLSYGFQDFEIKRLFESGAIVGYASVYGGAENVIPLMTEAPVTVFQPRDSQTALSAEIAYRGPLVAPVAQGVEAGRLRIFHGDILLSSAKLNTAAAVAQGTLGKRSLDALREIATSALRRLLGKAI